MAVRSSWLSAAHSTSSCCGPAFGVVFEEDAFDALADAARLWSVVVLKRRLSALTERSRLVEGEWSPVADSSLGAKEKPAELPSGIVAFQAVLAFV